MIIKIEPSSDIPIYAQITNQLIEGIARGNLHPGDSLPSVRSFASDIGVNMHTINKSYHELEKKGIIKIAPKSGAVICTPNKLQHKNHLLNEFKLVIAEAIVLGMNEEEIQELLMSIIQDLKKNLY
ncbi:GntR family transcriptional regulator [Bacillus mycoides]|uniref:GntR family transcriptional regulator n=1 Tax=Bacillus mycoides TaxID=1405 RepID=UPI0003E22FBA|nr:GntR family transcriptional regulator [Bacillus mycoides]ETT84682.1 GntR family transcriptional regulator [Bacillus mycoides FSL H7-687]